MSRISALAGLLLFIVGSGSATDVVITWGTPAADCHITVTSSNGVSIDPATGNLLAQGVFATSGCPTASVPPPSTPSFTQALGSTQTSPTSGQTFTLTWATSNVDHCTTDGSSFPAGVSFNAWPASGQICSGSACASGSIPLSSSVTGTHSFRLNCYASGNATPVTSSVDIGVGSTTPTACTGVTPPAGFTRQMSGNVDFLNGGTPLHYPGSNFTTFSGVFRSAWPGTRGLFSLSIVSNQYAALQFTVPAAPYNNNGTYFNTFTGSSGPFSTSISSCPGDFRTNVLSSMCFVDNAGKASLGWTTHAQDPSQAGLCPLVPGQTYYLNVLYYTANPPGSTCTGGGCTASINNSHN